MSPARSIRTKKDLLTLREFSEKEILFILKKSAEMKAHHKRGSRKQPLRGKTLALVFSKSSTRTRVSFETAMFQLGGRGIYLNQNDIQLGRGESVADTGRVLERYLDGIAMRTYAHQEVVDLAASVRIPVINALTDLSHPCQILADLLTIQEKKKKLRGLKMAYVGDGNNVANTLCEAAVKTGIELSIASPEGYECPPQIQKEAQGLVKFLRDPVEAVREADVIYTDTWISMGQESEKEKRLAVFQAYQVNESLFSRARPDCIFLHCLPAHRGEEVSNAVIDGPRSFVFDEAENRLHVQKAVLAILLS
ncbi:MAG: ornithine carbamoyltransferase [Spirochaetia bacterium]|nr:ornithine carbamoyltransferase [Spirochaetia bacterium]